MVFNLNTDALHPEQMLKLQYHHHILWPDTQWLLLLMHHHMLVCCSFNSCNILEVKDTSQWEQDAHCHGRSALLAPCPLLADGGVDEGAMTFNLL